MQDTKRLLHLLTERMPPGHGVSHSLALADDATLQVTVVIFGDRYVRIPIEGDDFLKPVDELVDEILIEARWRLPTAISFGAPTLLDTGKG